jgi:hypothetical protein
MYDKKIMHEFYSHILRELADVALEVLEAKLHQFCLLVLLTLYSRRQGSG